MREQVATLVGILYAGPIFNAEGEINFGLAPKVLTQTALHLGQCIWATELQAIVRAVDQRCKGLPVEDFSAA